MEFDLTDEPTSKKGPSNGLLLMTIFTILLLISATFQLGARSITQSISIKVKDAPLDKVFKTIEQQSGFYFVYNSAQIKQARLVTIDVSHATLEQVLLLCFKDQLLSYTIVDNLVVVKSKEKPHASIYGLPLTTDGEEPVIEVRGRVVNEKGEPVSGVTVSVKGKKKATFTNSEGEFSLTNIETNSVLVFTGANVETANINVAGQRQLSVTLNIRMSKLDEVQVIAYGTTTQRFSTGNITTVSGDDIRKQPVSNPLLALEGRVPGLFITQSNGLANSGVKVRIQGQNSIRAGNQPLYVVDGVPYPAQMLATTIGGPTGILGNPDLSQAYAQGGNGNPLSFINPSDIESVEVLKDADATSIYGSRAANGAILITTRKGKMGKTKVDINLQQGWARITKTVDMMNTQQYLEMRLEAKRNDNAAISSTDYDINGLWDTTRYTDWRKVLIGGTAQYTNLSANVSGGSGNTQYLVGTTWHRETNVFSGPFSDMKASMHFNISSSSENQKFRLQLIGNYLFDNNKLPTNDITSIAYSLAPDAPALYNADGTLNWAPNLLGNSSWTNPMAQLVNPYQSKTDNLVTNVSIGYRLLPGLDLKSSFGYTKLTTNEWSASYLESSSPENRTNASSRSARYTFSTMQVFLIEPQLNYNVITRQGKLNVLVGATVQQNNNSGQFITGSGFVTDELTKDMRSAATISISNTVASAYKYNALFGRLTYNWADKYILNATSRRDGSSRFGPANRFQNFTSIAGAWIFSEEKFIKKRLATIMSFGKVKVSYGTTGSDQIGDYQYMDLYTSNSSVVSYQNTPGSIATTGIPNPYLQWEETRKLSLGIDLGFIKDRVLATAVYAINRSSNQLLDYSLPYITGFISLVKNFPATVQNKNLELLLTTINIKKRNFTWSSNINITIPDNKLIAFPSLSTSTYASTLIIGQPISILKKYHFAGVDPNTGLYLFSDSHGTTTTSPAGSRDQVALINILPEYYGGFLNSWGYKGWQLDVFFQFVKQIGVNNYNFGYNTVPGGAKNQAISLLNRWKKPGDISINERYNSNSGLLSSFLNAQGSDAFYSDASYIRLKNISLSYQLPDTWLSKCHIQQARLYAQGQNLFTFTNYKGGDPESQSVTIAPLKVITFGLQASF